VLKIGAFVPLGTANVSPELMAAVGPALEERGFESVWVAEHVVMFDDYESKYPYADTGRFPAGGDVGLLEPMTALAAIATTTKTLRLGTGICLVSQRNPVYTAKQVADVDVMSGGRVDFGVGIGWLREEFDALNVPFERRGKRADEHLEVMKRLWTGETASYDGELYILPPSRLYPKPVQHPHPPIHVGGESDAAMRRAARLGQGWFGFNRTPDETVEAMERLDKALAAEGRSRADFIVSICPYLKPVDKDDVKKYEDLGVDRVIAVVFAFDREGLLQAADQVAASLL